MAERAEREELSNKIDSFVISEKAAMWVFGAILLFMFGHLWMLKSEVAEVQMAMAELRGNQGAMMQSIRDFTTNGSATAQQLKVLTEDIRARIVIIESWINKGDKLTKDDYIRLESRIRDLEAKRH